MPSSSIVALVGSALGDHQRPIAAAKWSSARKAGAAWAAAATRLRNAGSSMAGARVVGSAAVTTTPAAPVSVADAHDGVPYVTCWTTPDHPAVLRAAAYEVAVAVSPEEADTTTMRACFTEPPAAATAVRT